MQANWYSPFALKDLHQAIDLLDRKIAHCNTWETFVTQEARDVQLRKLSTKRAALVKSALALTDLGVRCDPKFLPRSLVQPVQIACVSPDAGAAMDEEMAKPARPRNKRR